MIDLYFWPTPNGYKASIMLAEVGLLGNVVPVDITAGDQFKSEYLAISPNNKVPAIVDHEGPGGKPIAMFESGAILIYLAEKTGQLLSHDPVIRLETLQWLMFQMGGLGPMLGQAHHFREYAPEPIDYAIQRYTDEAARLYQVLEKRLGTVEYLAGEYSALFLKADFIIKNNLLEREQNSGTGCAFPRWWEEFFMIGTNGGGDFYCLRLDNKPGVWVIGSDCADVPEKVADTLHEFIKQLVAKHAEYLQELAEIAERRIPYEAEYAAHLEVIDMIGGPQLARDWIEFPRGGLAQMLDHLRHRPSTRKMRLHAIALCRLNQTLEEDEDCAAAIRLAEQATFGKVPKGEIAAMWANWKEKSEQLTLQFESMDPDVYHSIRNRISSVWYLFREDYDDLDGIPGRDVGYHLLREVLGNPFMPVEFQPQWRTEAVVELARTMYESQDFGQMATLADELAAAGCDDPRIITHCRRTVGHVRGCWVIDLILENEPEPSDEFTWDFKCTHPNVDPVGLKQWLQDFGSEGKYDPNDDNAVLAFADWLEQNGDPAWSEYIRICCAVDEKSPPDNYADFVERRCETFLALPSNIVEFENFNFGYWGGNVDSIYMLHLGIPAQIQAVIPGKGAPPADQTAQRIDALVRNSPVRGVAFDQNYRDEMADILNSPGCRQLRWLDFANRHERSPVIKALAESPTAANLERLKIGLSISSDGDVLTLAQTPFENLRRLTLVGVRCSDQAGSKLMTSEWFQKLQQLHVGYSDYCDETSAILHLSKMPHLHTLAFSRWPKTRVLGFDRADEFSALRRLSISGGGDEISQLKAPRLIELGLSTADLRPVIESPLFNNLSILRLGLPKVDLADFDRIAQRPCAKKLRILRLHGGNSLQSLSSIALTHEGAFPALTTLEIHNPFAQDAKRDCAEFLQKLATPNLRHLILRYCDFDNACADILAKSATYANLTRLEVWNEEHKKDLLSPEMARRLFHSTNLQNLVELHLFQFNIGDAWDVFTDKSIMPNLARATARGGDTPRETSDRLRSERPVISF